MTANAHYYYYAHIIILRGRAHHSTRQIWPIATDRVMVCWSVCLSVTTVSHTEMANWDAISDVDSSGTKELCIRWESRSRMGRGKRHLRGGWHQVLTACCQPAFRLAIHRSSQLSHQIFPTKNPATMQPLFKILWPLVITYHCWSSLLRRIFRKYTTSEKNYSTGWP